MTDKNVDKNTELLDQVKINIPHEQDWAKYTKVVFGLFLLFYVASFMGYLPLDYNLFFFALSVITGVYFFIEKFYLKKFLIRDEDKQLIRPWWLSWTSGIFPVVIFLFLFRGVVGEPFRIPTGSMIPTIMIGEFVATNKLAYDIKIPVIEKTVLKMNPVERGDVVVFRYPPNPTVYYIKRFVGIPGDTVEYNFATKILTVNGQKSTQEKIMDIKTLTNNVIEYKEDLLGKEHSIWIDPKTNYVPDSYTYNKSLAENCDMTIVRMICTIPAGYYFALGDNRDNSQDSRYWGLVPHKNIVGQAKYTIFSSEGFSRMGHLN